MDSVMVECDERSQIEQSELPAWFSRVLAFVRIPDKQVDGVVEKEMCFVQFYVVLSH